MKFFLAIILSILIEVAFSQETLESISSNGNTTSNSLYIRSSSKINAPYHSLLVGQRPLADGVASIWLTGNNNNNNGSFGAIYHSANDNTLRLYNLVDALAIKNNGFIGIGTNNPGNQLVVQNTSHVISEIVSSEGNAALYLRAGNTSHYPHIRFDQGGNGKMEMGVDPAQGFYFNHNTSTGSNNADLYLSASQNVGIGTTNPANKLVIQGQGQIVSEIASTDDNAALYIKAASLNRYPHIRFDQGGLGKIEMGVDLAQGFYLSHSTSNGSNGADFYISASKDVGIGTTTPKEKLSVNGKIRAHEIKVEIANWPDYVFSPSYKLPNLKATEQFIRANNHLPEIPSAAEVEKEGISLGEMNAKLLKKIEELTLHLIEQDKKQSDLVEEVRILKAALSKLTTKP
jgi:hypothetical protein